MNVLASAVEAQAFSAEIFPSWVSSVSRGDPGSWTRLIHPILLLTWDLLSLDAIFRVLCLALFIVRHRPHHFCFNVSLVISVEFR